ncbi:MAG: hypothetical protein KatS3mg096_599 [Candidatus Parcubacteria bacterium]|nr:MAG: hypothetical protein KatS3mg096_599 [Candidatus Parcubacteria bacterium]
MEKKHFLTCLVPKHSEIEPANHCIYIGKNNNNEPQFLTYSYNKGIILPEKKNDKVMIDTERTGLYFSEKNEIFFKKNSNILIEFGNQIYNNKHYFSTRGETIENFIKNYDNDDSMYFCFTSFQFNYIHEEKKYEYFDMLKKINNENRDFFNLSGIVHNTHIEPDYSYDTINHLKTKENEYLTDNEIKENKFIKNTFFSFIKYEKTQEFLKTLLKKDFLYNNLREPRGIKDALFEFNYKNIKNFSNNEKQLFKTYFYNTRYIYVYVKIVHFDNEKNNRLYKVIYLPLSDVILFTYYYYCYFNYETNLINETKYNWKDYFLERITNFYKVIISDDDIVKHFDINVNLEGKFDILKELESKFMNKIFVDARILFDNYHGDKKIIIDFADKIINSLYNNKVMVVIDKYLENKYVSMVNFDLKKININEVLNFIKNNLEYADDYDVIDLYVKRDIRVMDVRDHIHYLVHEPFEINNLIISYNEISYLTNNFKDNEFVITFNGYVLSHKSSNIKLLLQKNKKQDDLIEDIAEIKGEELEQYIKSQVLTKPVMYKINKAEGVKKINVSNLISLIRHDEKNIYALKNIKKILYDDNGDIESFESKLLLTDTVFSDYLIYCNYESVTELIEIIANAPYKDWKKKFSDKITNYETFFLDSANYKDITATINDLDKNYLSSTLNVYGEYLKSSTDIINNDFINNFVKELEKKYQNQLARELSLHITLPYFYVLSLLKANNKKLFTVDKESLALKKIINHIFLMSEEWIVSKMTQNNLNVRLLNSDTINNVAKMYLFRLMINNNYFVNMDIFSMFINSNKLLELDKYNDYIKSQLASTISEMYKENFIDIEKEQLLLSKLKTFEQLKI